MIANYSMLMLLAAVPAAAQTADAGSAPVTASPKPVCRREATTGSIMPGKRTCHTPAEWKDIDAANAKAVDNFRNQANRSGGLGS